jgi:hypothetical protein
MRVRGARLFSKMKLDLTFENWGSVVAFRMKICRLFQKKRCEKEIQISAGILI